MKDHDSTSAPTTATDSDSAHDFGSTSVLLSTEYDLDHKYASRLLLEGYSKSSGNILYLGKLLLFDIYFFLSLYHLQNHFSELYSALYISLYIFLRILAIGIPLSRLKQKFLHTPASWWGLRTLTITPEHIRISPAGSLLSITLNRRDVQDILATSSGYHLQRQGFQSIFIPRYACSLQELQRALFLPLDTRATSSFSHIETAANPFDNLNRYELTHLVEHLEAAWLEDRLYQLFSLETPDKSNAWFAITEAHFGLDEYVSQVRSTWRLNATPSYSDGPHFHETLVRTVHYTLILSSTNTLEDTPLELVAALVDAHLWTPSQAFFYVSRYFEKHSNLSWDRDEFLKSIRALSPHPPEELVQKLLISAQQLQTGSSQVLAYAALLPCLRSDQQKEVLEAALRVARSIPVDKDDAEKAEALAVLVPFACATERPHLASEVLKLLITSKERTNKGFQEASSLSKSLDPNAEGSENDGKSRKKFTLTPSVMILVQASIHNVEGEQIRKSALKSIAPYLCKQALMDAIYHSFHTSDEQYSLAIQDLLPHLRMLDKAQKAEIMRRVGREITGGEDSNRYVCVQILISLVPHLSRTASREALLVADTLKDKNERVSVFAAIASTLEPHDKTDVLQRALATATTIPDKTERAEALSGLVPLFVDEEREHILRLSLKAAAAIPNFSGRAGVLISLIPYAPLASIESLIAETTRVIEKLDYLPSRIEHLADLAKTLPEDLQLPILQNAVETFREYRLSLSSSTDRSTKQAGIAKLAPHLPPKLLQVLRDEAIRIRDDIPSIAFLGTSFPYLSTSLQRHTLDSLATTKDSALKVKTYAAVSPYVSDQNKTLLLTEALECSLRLKKGFEQLDALAELTPMLPPDKKRLAIKAALKQAQLEKNLHAVKALVAISSHFSEDDKRTLLRTGLSTLGKTDTQSYVRVLALLVPFIPLPTVNPRHRAFSQRVEKSVNRRFEKFMKLVSVLMGKIDVATLLMMGTATGSRDLWNLEFAISTALGNHLFSMAQIAEDPHYYGAKDEMQRELFRQLGSLEKNERLKRLITWLPHLSTTWRSEGVQAALDIARTLDTSGYRMDGTLHVQFEAFAALTKYLSGDQKVEIIDRLHELAESPDIDSLCKVQRLTELMAHETVGRQYDIATYALQTAFTIDDDTERADALSTIASNVGTLSSDELVLLWRMVLEHIVTRSRKTCIADLGVLLPIIIRLGGPRSVRKIADSLLAVTRWWP